MITFRFTGTDGTMVEAEQLTSGMVKKKVKLEFSNDWDNRTKMVVFTAGSVSRDVVCESDVVEIPAEVLAKPLQQLYVGVYGVSDDGEVTPTIHAMGPKIAPGVNPSGDQSTTQSLPVWAQLLAMIGELQELDTDDRDNLVAAINELLSKVGTGGGNVDLSGYVKSFNGKGPNEDGNVEVYIPAKPEDIGALPDTYTPPIQTAEQVGADAKGTAAAAVSGHNTALEAHGDLRLELKALADRLSAFLDSDDATLDQLSELIAGINSNKSLIEAVTTGKISVTDIIDNLTTNVANRPLSAAQGVVLKGQIDTARNDLSGKLDADKLPDAVNTALGQAKASGEFDGAPGTSVTVSKVTESTEDGGNNVVTFSDGKTLTVKNGGRGSTGPQGESGKDGADGKTPVKGTDYFTAADKADIVNQVKAALTTENWTFTLEDGSSVTKAVLLG